MTLHLVASQEEPRTVYEEMARSPQQEFAKAALALATAAETLLTAVDIGETRLSTLPLAEALVRFRELAAAPC